MKNSVPSHKVNKEKAERQVTFTTDPCSSNNNSDKVNIPVSSMRNSVPSHTDNNNAPSNFSNSTQLGTASNNYPQSSLNYAAQPFTAPPYPGHYQPVSRLPLPKPPIFHGDVLEFPQWKIAFEALVVQSSFTDQEKFYYLKESIAGDALKCIESMFWLDATLAYPRSMERLESRFGNPVAISHEFYNRLSNWIRLGPSDNKGLREFSDFLQQCCVAKVVYTSLNILDSEKENCMLCTKLPDWLANRWIRHAAKFRQAYNYFPSFEDFANFLMKESDIACDPVLSMRSVVEARKKLSSSQPERKVVAHSVKSSTTKRYCFHCEKDHYLFSCESFAELPLVGRFEVVKRHKLCFNCLRTGHGSKQCSFKLLCKLCKGKHSTLIHNLDSSIKNKESETELTQLNTVDEAVAHFSTNFYKEMLNDCTSLYFT